MIEELAKRVWETPRLHEGLQQLSQDWLQRELEVEARGVLGEDEEEDEFVKLLQAAVILAASSDEKHQRAAYDIATYGHDLARSRFPGVAGLVRVILTRLGNFPAMRTSEKVAGFYALPTTLAVEEEVRRRGNQLDLGDVQLALTDFQARLWKALTTGSNVVISGPTSAGKSFILQTFLRQLAASGRLRHACYLVPSRALISQVTDDIVAWRNADGLNDLVVLNVPVSKEAPLPDRAIFVLTQERLQVLLGAHPGFSPEIVIVDEAQNVQDGSRGVLLSSVVDALLANRPDAQVVFAGPNLRNGEVFGDMFGLDEVSLNKTTTVVVGQNLINVITKTFEKGWVRFETLKERSDERVDLGGLDLGSFPGSKRARLAKIGMALGGRSATIVYADDPNQAEEIAKLIAEPRKVAEDENLRTIADFITDAVHPQYVLADLIPKRVGFHYGRMPSLVRRSVEEAFSKGELDVLVTTSTLLQGVNFPAKNLVMLSPRKGDDPLDGSDFWNLAGRAGRLGREFHGNVYLIDYDEWTKKPLTSDRELQILPYLQEALTVRRDDLLAAAQAPDPGQESKESTRIEAALLRLHLDAKADRLPETLQRCGIDADSPRGREIVNALAFAEQHVTLPRAVLISSPTVAAFRQQRLFDYLLTALKRDGERALAELMPLHPREFGSRQSLARVYKICHEKILGLFTDRLHFRFAAISQAWMNGDSMPEIINTNASYSQGKAMPSVIRGTLNDIEQEVRFKYFRLTSCYLTLLEHALRACGMERFASRIPALPLFLEVGASSRTMISLMGLGLSRVTASRLADETLEQDLEPGAARQWLGALDLDKVNISRILADDVRRTIAQGA